MFQTSPLLERARVVHGFSLRTGGVSSPPFDSLNLGSSVGDAPAAVEENLRRLARAAGIPRESLRGARQVHGDRVLLVGRGEVGPEEEADALHAVEPGLAVSVKTADCVPILLYEADSGEAVAVHAGWRGTRAAIVRRAVESLVSRGGRPERILAAIGPAIGPCCYEVSHELAAEFRAAYGEEAAVGRRLDLPGINRLLLLRAGVPEDRIDLLRACTACDPERYFSHRRDAGRTGRHLSFVLSGSARPIS